MKRLILLAVVIVALLAAYACAPAPTPVPTQPPATAAPKPSEASKPAGAVWPTKDVTFIVPFSPGGGYDTQARIVQSVWPKYLAKKVNLVVTNQSGAGGKIGSLALMKAPADGVTIGILSPSSLALMQSNGELESFDIRKLTWLGQLSMDPGVVVANTASGLKTPQDLSKREIRIGVTSESLFANTLLAKKMTINARTVMFDGSPEQVLAAMRGDVDLMMDSWTSMKKAVDNSQGKLVPLFVVSDKRLPGWSDVPTSKEIGLELGDLQAIAGTARLVAAPAGVPAESAKAMEESLWGALQDPEYKAAMVKAGYDATFIARGADSNKTVATIMSVLEQNKDVLNSLKK